MIAKMMLLFGKQKKPKHRNALAFGFT